MKKTKETAAFYAEKELIEDIRHYTSYNKIPFSDIVNQALQSWYDLNKEDVNKCVIKNKEIEKLINSYKNK